MSHTTAWIYLVASGLVDVAWALSMKKAQGFANPGWTAISIILLGVFVYLLTKALEVLPVGSAYAVWTGIGAAGTVALGIVLFAEPVTVLRIFFIVLIIAGVVGLQMTT